MSLLAFRLALGSFGHKPLSKVVVIVSVASVLVMNGLVFVCLQGFSRSLAEVRGSSFMTVYLSGDVAAAKEAELLSAVRKQPGVSEAALVSKDAVLANLNRFFPQLAEELGPLDPEAIPRYVKVKTPSLMPGEVQGRLQKLRGVESVEINEHRYAGLIHALVVLRRLSMVLLAGMSLALLCILVNHFKLGTGHQSQLRRTLALLGGSPGRILSPFVIEGMIEGGLGGLLAGGVLLSCGRIFESQMGSVFSAMGYQPFHVELMPVAACLAMLGILSGMMGSLWAAVRLKN